MLLQHRDQWTACLKKLYVLFFRYFFCSIFLTVYRNYACNIPLKIYGVDATSPCWTLFKIHHSLRAVSKIVRLTTNGSERFLAFFSKPLVGTKHMIHRWKGIVATHLFRIYYFSNSLRFKSSFEFTKSRKFFEFFQIFRYCFHSSFLTVCRNKACNIPLESYERGATFICWNVFEIPYGF